MYIGCTVHGQTVPGAQIRTFSRLTMISLLRALLCLGLTVEHKTAVLAGSLPKPIIWAEPGTVIAIHTPVTIWCQGSWEAQQYLLHKEKSADPWDIQLPVENMTKAMFVIDHMTLAYADIYKCSYRSSSGLSECSDTLELVMTGAYEKPSLSVWPSLDVAPGESITMQCSSSLPFGRFILIHEEKHSLSWTLDSQKHSNQLNQALFLLDSVTPSHSGTFRCYGSFRNQSQVWSKSSNPLDLLVSEPTTSELQDYTVHLTRMIMASLVLVTLVILLLEAWYSQKVEQDPIRR